jgi:hypothetical protein
MPGRSRRPDGSDRPVAGTASIFPQNGIVSRLLGENMPEDVFPFRDTGHLPDQPSLLQGAQLLVEGTVPDAYHLEDAIVERAADDCGEL